MSNNDDPDDPKVTRFPEGKRRRGVLRLMAANDAEKDEPFLNLPPAVQRLTFVLLLVFAAQEILPFFVGEEKVSAWIYALAFVPARYSQPLDFSAFVSPVTHLFLHGGWLHIGINLLSLMAFGAGIETWLGGRRMLLIYFLSGILAALAQYIVAPDMPYPMIGASGAISGLFGALLIQIRERGRLGGGAMKLVPFVLLWVALSLFFGMFGMPGAGGAIAWAAHIGGFLAGLALSRPVARLKLE
jgi:membrane associated rhomboid family serine protease